MAKSKAWYEFQSKMQANAHKVQANAPRVSAADREQAKLKHFPTVSPVYISNVETAQMRAELFDKIMADNEDRTPLTDAKMAQIPNPTPQEIVRNVEELVASVRVASKKEPVIYSSAKKQNFNFGFSVMQVLSGNLAPTELDDRSREMLHMHLPRPTPETEIDNEI